jgi:hypothetical protein
MKIEYNEKEIAAMAEFHKGNRAEGLRLQEEFASEFRKEYADKDHCPCQKACRYHGNCKECVAIHRAHQEHVPNCMRPMINMRLRHRKRFCGRNFKSRFIRNAKVTRKLSSDLNLLYGKKVLIFLDEYADKPAMIIE